MCTVRICVVRWDFMLYCRKRDGKHIYTYLTNNIHNFQAIGIKNVCIFWLWANIKLDFRLSLSPLLRHSVTQPNQHRFKLRTEKMAGVLYVYIYALYWERCVYVCSTWICPECLPRHQSSKSEWNKMENVVRLFTHGNCISENVRIYKGRMSGMNNIIYLWSELTK